MLSGERGSVLERVSQFSKKKIATVMTLFLNFAVDQIFREANISPNGMVKYEEFVKIVCAPVPDYY